MTGRSEFTKATKGQRYVFARGKCEGCGCDRPARGNADGRRLCGMHYQRWAKYGSTELPSRIATKDGLCVAEGCGRPVRALNSFYCEAHYYRLRRSSKLALSPIAQNCERCGSSLTKNQSRFCSDRCSWRFGRDTKDEKSCVVCGSVFQVKSTAITCSAVCSDGHARAQKKIQSSRYAKLDYVKERLREREMLRKARKNSSDSEVFSRLEIFERDNWRCGLCHNKIPKGMKWPHPQFASIDHIQPLARGGSHTRLNVQAAHLLCNIRKNAHGGGQLRLFA